MRTGAEALTAGRRRLPDELHAKWGPFQLLREGGEVSLGPWWKAQRSYAMHDTRSTSHLVYTVGSRYDRSLRRRVDESSGRLTSLSDPHLLRYECVGMCERRGCCIVTPYTGDQTGLLTLRRLRDLKGGRLPEIEVLRAVEHLLNGVRALHAAGLSDGSLTLDRALVDRHGSVVIELAGLPVFLTPDDQAMPELRRADLVAVGRMTYELLYGKAPGRKGVERISSAPQSGWDLWLFNALDPWEGFASAEVALSLLPRESPASPRGVVRKLIDWISNG